MEQRYKSRTGAEVGMWWLWAIPSGSLRLGKACRAEVVAATSYLGSSKALRSEVDGSRYVLYLQDAVLCCLQK